MGGSEPVDVIFLVLDQIILAVLIGSVLVDKAEIETVLSPIYSHFLVELVGRSFDVVGAASVVEGVFQSVVVEE